MDILREFSPPQDSLCVCQKKYVVNPYKGCEYDCVYCYARPWWIRWKLTNEEGKIKKIIPKYEIIKRLKEECEKVDKERKHPVLLSSITDAWQPIEKELNLTRKIIKILKEYDFPIMVQTKSDLVIRDVDILSQSTSFVSISISSLEEGFKRFEQYAPTVEKRLDTLNSLSNREIKTGIFLDPIIPGINDHKEYIERVLREVKNAGALHVTVGVLRLNRVIFKHLEKTLTENEIEKLERIYFELGEKRAGYLYAPPSYRINLLKTIVEICKKYNLTFGGCRTGFSELNTSACDGRDYLKIERIRV